MIILWSLTQAKPKKLPFWSRDRFLNYTMEGKLVGPSASERAYCGHVTRCSLLSSVLGEVPVLKLSFAQNGSFRFSGLVGRQAQDKFLVWTGCFGYNTSSFLVTARTGGPLVSLWSWHSAVCPRRPEQWSALVHTFLIFCQHSWTPAASNPFPAGRIISRLHADTTDASKCRPFRIRFFAGRWHLQISILDVSETNQ